MPGNDDEMIGLTRAKAELNKVTARANETGRPVTVLKRNAPWVRIVPLAARNRSGKEGGETWTSAAR